MVDFFPKQLNYSSFIYTSRQSGTKIKWPLSLLPTRFGKGCHYRPINVAYKFNIQQEPINIDWSLISL